MEHELGFALRNAWLILAIPFFSFLVVGLFIRPRAPKLAGIVATLAVFASAGFAYALAVEYLSLGGHDGWKTIVPWSFEWLRFQEHLAVHIGVIVDPISVLLMVVVTTVSSLVHLYSLGYMHGEAGFGRYFTWLNLFTFSMLALVTAPNILQMYVAWELVGASSFCLIGYYFEKPSAVEASKKAFIVTRFADLGFLLGVLILGYFGYQIASEAGGSAQAFDFLFLTNPEVMGKFSALGAGLFGIPLLTLALLLVYMGGAGKSAMFPLHIWLPDAMEGPTPVSALIHAATMVVAGVYLVARLFPLFATSGDALLVVAYIGAFTSVFAAVIACTQDDIKRVLAYSTLSQLGYMMFALGVASFEHPLGYTASMFHLFTHAFFKALLFLGAGSVIHAVHSNEIWKMGGLKAKMPVTHATFAIATLAIAGIWPFAGFFSKDEILAAALGSGHTGIFTLGLMVAGLTAFYMSRIYFVTFWGKAKTEHASHAHESPWIMLIPLVILAVLSIGAGFVPFGEFVRFGAAHGEAHGINPMIAAAGTLAGVLGIGFAWLLYRDGLAERSGVIARALGGGYRLIRNKFYFDELYLFVTHKIIFRLVAAPIAWFDRHVVDGGVNLSGWSARVFGSAVSYLQTGQVQTYGSWFVGGAVLLLFSLWMLRA
ncbi:MAG: NADH-quinone oxidoreductase subunit L [Oligoflexia bacterium]|nr:NADH-quinone oxidoreductase subunit L [Oligoflexia bacterium]